MDNEKRIKELENKLAEIQSIAQLPATATINDVIIAINKITKSIKRRR